MYDSIDNNCHFIPLASGYQKLDEKGAIKLTDEGSKYFIDNLCGDEQFK